jgi:D-amino-acid dehydrogenase
MSAGSGKVLADQIVGVQPEISVDGLSIQRYAKQGETLVVPMHSRTANAGA